MASTVAASLPGVAPPPPLDEPQPINKLESTKEPIRERMGQSL
jgi:hypothetical protein